MLDLVGANFELNLSVNPEFEAEIKGFPKHPITQGATPFTLKDEWYFNLRFRDGMKGITPLVTAIPPASSMSRAASTSALPQEWVTRQARTIPDKPSTRMCPIWHSSDS